MSEERTGNAPILIDFGKQKRGRVKKLRRGEGRLMAHGRNASPIYIPRSSRLGGG